MAQEEIVKIIKIDADDANRTLDELNSKIDKVQGSVNKINDVNENSQKTVKDLRNEIKSLRDELVNLEKGSDAYNEVVKKLVEDETKLTDVMRAGKNEVTAAKGSYNALQNEMTSLRKVWKETTDEATRSEIGARIREINDQLKAMDESIGNHQRKVGSYEEALKKINGQYASQRQELRALKEALDALDPSSEEYTKAFNRAAEITHNLTDRQEMLKYSSADLGDQLSNINGIAANLAAGFGAVNAAIGLFGGETEEVQKAMLKVQQTMALVQGLQGLDGFIKRTQGLSEAMKVWIAQAKAAKTATEAQTVAQNGLNAAIKSNPIGFLIGAIVLLIANWKKLTEWVGKLVGGFDNLKKAMNTVKQVASGVANALIKALLVPFKEILNYAQTVGKVMIDIFTFKWDKIGEDIKNGIGKSVDIIKDGYDIAGNYASAKEKEITRQTEKAIRERAELRNKELTDIIADNEAKSGSDWKYTEEGKKYYTEYFETLLAKYKKDSDEFKEAQREKWEFDRDIVEHEKKAAEDAKKKEEEDRKKRLAAAKTYADKLKKVDSDYQNKVEKLISQNTRTVIEEFKEQSSAFVAYYENMIKKLEEKLKKDSGKLDAVVLSDGKKAIEEMKEGLEIIKKEFEKYTGNEEGIVTASFFSSLSPNEIRDRYASLGVVLLEEDEKLLREEKDLWNEYQKQFGDINNPVMIGEKMTYEFGRLHNRFLDLLQDSMFESETIVNKKLNDDTIKLFQKTIVPNVEKELVILQNKIDKKKIKLDFEIETGSNFDSFIGSGVMTGIENFDKKSLEFQRATEIYNNSLKQLSAQLNYYEQTVKFAEKNRLTQSDEYENAVEMVKQLTTQMQQLYIDYYNTNAEIRERYFNKELDEIDKQTNTELALTQRKYSELYTKNVDYMNMRNQLSGTWPEKELEIMNQEYEVVKNGLERRKSAYQEMLNSEYLTATERVKLETELANTIAEIEENEIQHTIDTNEKRIEIFQNWYSIAQDTVGGIADLISGLADYYEQDIEAKVKAGKITEEQADKEFEHVKGMRIAEAVINTLAGSIGAYLQAVATYPPPAGEIIGAISAAAVAAAGAAQIAQIKATKRNGGTSTSNTPVATPQTNVYQPTYVENPTGDNETQNLRNTMMEQPIYVKVTDIEATQSRVKTRETESSF